MVRYLNGVLSQFDAVMITGIDTQKPRKKYEGKEEVGKDRKKAGREERMNSEARKIGREERKDGAMEEGKNTGQGQK